MNVRDEHLSRKRLAHYEIVSRIGGGGLGDVFEGFEPSLNRRVAIRVLPQSLFSDRERPQEFNAILSASASITHPYVIPVHFIGADDGCHFYAMEFVNGGTLSESIAQVGRFKPSDVVAITKQILTGLGAAHSAGVVHKALTPNQILLASDRRHVVLADFGISKWILDRRATTISTDLVDMAAYLSPEQGLGHPADPRSDLYAVGVIMYELLAGRHPFAAQDIPGMILQHVETTPRALKHVVIDIPDELSSFVLQLLEKSADERFSDAATALAALSEISTKVDDRRSDSQVIFAPTFPAAPSFSSIDEIPTRESWWGKLLALVGWKWSTWPQQAMERFADTQQQVDIAVHDYEQRRSQLKSLVDEAEAVLVDLRRQSGDRDADSESNGRLRQEAELQASQLDSMRLKLHQIEARLEMLRSQRDVLNARLKTAQARTPPSDSSRPRIPIVRLGLVSISLLFAIVIFRRSLAPHSLNRSLVVDSGTMPGQFETQSRSITRHALFQTEVAGDPLLELEGDFTDLASLAVSADKSLLAILRQDGTGRYVQLKSGHTLLEFPEMLSTMQDTILSSNAEVAIGRDRASEKVRVWNLHAGKGVAFETQYVGRPVDVHRDEILILTGNGESDRALVVMDDAAAAEQMTSFTLPQSSRDLVLSRNANWIAVRTSSNGLNVISRSSRDQYTLDVPDASVFAVHPTRPWLATLHGQSSIQFSDLETEAVVASLNEIAGAVKQFTFDLTGRRIAVATEDHVLVWDLYLHYVRQMYDATNVRMLRFSDEGTELAVAMNDRIAVLDTSFPVLELNLDEWISTIDTTAQNLIVKNDPEPDPSDIHRKSLSPDGKFEVLREETTGTAILRSVKTKEVLYRFEDERLMSAAFSPDGESLAIGGGVGELRLWDWRRGRRIRAFQGQVHYGWQVAFTPDSKTLLSAGKGTVHVWDVETGAMQHTFPLDTLFMRKLSTLHDGELIVAGTKPPRSQVRIFSRDPPERIANLDGSIDGYEAVTTLSHELLFDVRYGNWEKGGSRVQ